MAEVNRLCSDAERRSEDIPEPRTADDFLPFLRRSIEVGEEDQERFEALDPPSSLRRYHRRSIEQGEDLLEQFETAADGIEEGADPMAVFERLLPELVRSIEEGNRDARRLGLDDCVVELPAAGAPPPSES